MQQHHYAALFLIAALAFTLGIAFANRNRPRRGPFAGSDMLRGDADYAGDYATTQPAMAPRLFKELIDPWDIQRDLMEASGQELPDAPKLTHGALLYAALNMEEQAETYNAMCKVLRMHMLENPDNALMDVHYITQHMEAAAMSLDGHSQRIRDLLKQIPWLPPLPLGMEDAVEILDGVTDVAVVNCGLALAMGFNGSAAYEEVGGSNLSKVNPVTGKIDKTPDGKWIKGPNYRKPDLEIVIARTQHERDVIGAMEHAWARAARADAEALSPSDRAYAREHNLTR